MQKRKIAVHYSCFKCSKYERYNEVKIQYPGFTWDPPLIDIGTLVTLVQRTYPAQVVEYTLGHGKKSNLDVEDAVKHKVEEPAGLFSPRKPKVNNDYQESFRDFNEEQLINEVNDDDRGSYQPPDKNGHDYRSKSRSRKTMHTEKDTDMILWIEEIGMTAIQSGQIIVIIIS